MQSVLFVIAHPDGLAYGMGGMALLLKDSVALHLVCATKGERGYPGQDLAETGAMREQDRSALDVEIVKRGDNNRLEHIC